MLIKVQKATTMCMYVAHWNIFMVNKCDLPKQTTTKNINFPHKITLSHIETQLLTR